MLLSRLVNWLDRYRIGKRASTCSFVVFASYGFTHAASLSIYICAPSSAVLQVLGARSVRLQTHNWESVESETGYACRGPQVMTGLRWHLLECSSGLPGLDGVIPSFHFFPLIFYKLQRAGQWTPRTTTFLLWNAFISLPISTLCISSWQGCFISRDSFVPTYWCQMEEVWIPPLVPLAPTSHEEEGRKKSVSSAEGAEWNNASFFSSIRGLSVWVM